MECECNKMQLMLAQSILILHHSLLSHLDDYSGSLEWLRKASKVLSGSAFFIYVLMDLGVGRLLQDGIVLRSKLKNWAE